MKERISLFWFRRDLRLEDNHALYQSLTSGLPVLPVFIFDKNILQNLKERADARVHFIHQSLTGLKSILKHQGSDLKVIHHTPIEAFRSLLDQYEVEAVYTNHDYEPYAIQRDMEVRQLLAANHIPFHSFKDQVIFEKDEVVKDNGDPYVVFTPYAKKWRKRFTKDVRETRYPSEKRLSGLIKTKDSFWFPALEELGFKASSLTFPENTSTQRLIRDYEKNRDFPGIEGTSRLSVHFRFGTISVREKALKAFMLSDTWLNELIWRDFYAQILYHFPHVVKSAFKPAYELIEWRNDPEHLEAWKSGQTGYPIVDAGMRQLNATGFMHNRVRMITASFLCKHLLTDWREGELYFAEKLLDFDLASINGGWQWASGSGCDAAPYFRVFNPDLQTQKFDPEHQYIKRWVPEYKTQDYTTRIVDHKTARERAIDIYKKALQR